VQVDRQLPAGTRVTVRMPSTSLRAAAIVSPREPRETAALHWGFSVRIAHSFPAVWFKWPFKGRVRPEHRHLLFFSLPAFQHLLLFFGGLEDIEPLVAADEDLVQFNADADSLFDLNANVCPSQGSRTIWTEQALLVDLSAMGPHIERATLRGDRLFLLVIHLWWTDLCFKALLIAVNWQESFSTS